MNRQKITILLSALLFVSLISNAQFESPYSQYGIGDLSKSGFGPSQAMGGIGIGYRTNLHLNNRNVASLTALDSNSVIYELGASLGFNKLESNTGSNIRNKNSIDYLALGFKVKKMWYTGISLKPISRMDYILQNSISDKFGDTVDIYYSGIGGINKVSWSNAFKINNNISLGVNLNYLFGSIDQYKTVVFTDDPENTNPTKYDDHSYFMGFTMDYGIQYSQELNKDLNITAGLTYSNPWKINRSYEAVAGTMRVTGSNPIRDYIYGHIRDTADIGTTDGKEKIELPQKLGLGFTLNKKNKYSVGADIDYETWSNFKFNNQNANLRNSFSIKTGFEITPDHKSITRVYKRFTYRLGGYYDMTNLKVFNESINDMGVSFGVGIPFSYTKTSLNVAFKLGQRGTTESNLVKETYGMLSLNLSLSDIWFLKRKYK